MAGLVTGPIHAPDELGHTSQATPGAVVGMLAVESAVGIVCGLATGVASDALVLLGRTQQPTANWSNPFRTNCTAIPEGVDAAQVR